MQTFYLAGIKHAMILPVLFVMFNFRVFFITDCSLFKVFTMDYFDIYENLIESSRYPLLVSYKTNDCKICLLA